MMIHEGTPESWRRLIELLKPFHDQAAATARRLSRSPDEGDDLFQEAVLRGHRKLSSLRDPSRFRSWFYAILLSVHRNRCRSWFWKRFLSLDDPDVGGYEPSGSDQGGEAGADSERVRSERASRALATLPAVQREAVVLFEIDGFSIEEIAAVQKVSRSAVKSRLVRGRDRLRKHYEKLGFRSRERVLETGRGLNLPEGSRS